jgi:hygromycin-B 7''-O-kinase
MSATGGGRDDAPAVTDAIRRELGLGDGVERFATGSVPVFAVGARHVVKLFPPAERAFFETEWAALTHLDGCPAIPAPRPVASGQRGAWFYVVMTRLPGVAMVEAWPSIELDDRLRLIREVGAALAALHATPTGALRALAVDWPAFVDAQRVSCRERQQVKGLGSPWVDAVEDFLARWTPRDDGARVLLHTEVMRQHVLVERHQGAWRLSGLIDFEPAMLGAPEYELASAGVFLTCAEPRLLRVFLEAYGARADGALPYRIMAYALLHRYSNLRWYLERLPVPEGVRDLEALARAWFTP